MHLPWSLGLSSDDKVIKSLDRFIGQRVIVTEKMDGENVTMYNDYIHQRSLTSQLKETYNSIIKEIWSEFNYMIPQHYRICCESLIAQHSIPYNDLNSFIQIFNVWCKNKCLSWDDTIDTYNTLNVYSTRLAIVPILYDGIYNQNTIHNIWQALQHTSEGYVIRIADSFDSNEFNQCVGKYVRPNHVTTETHWKHSKITLNQLK